MLKAAPGSGLIVESHVNCSELSVSDEALLVASGFVPDDFREPNPPELRRHFTLTIDVLGEDRKRGDVRVALQRVRKAALAAGDLLVGRLHVMGYIELELSRKVDNTQFPPSPALPCHTLMLSEAERRLSLPASSGARRADVHVKMGTSLTARAVEKLFLHLGLYRVVSGSGNVLWTCHFVNRSEARSFATWCSNIAAATGAIKQVTLESCVALYPLSESSQGLIVSPRRFRIDEARDDS